MKNILAILLYALCVSNVYAAYSLSEFKSLIKNGTPLQAYQYASQHLKQQEGDPEFDYLYGISAIESGEISKGIFALERVLIIQPKNHIARLELARGYFLLEEDVRAREEFTKTLKLNPPPAVKKNIQAFLDKIRLREKRYKASARAYVEVGAGYDTNVTAGPGDASFTSPIFGQLSLDSASLEADDAFYTLNTGAKLIHPVAPGQYLSLGADASLRYHGEREEFDTQLVSANVLATIIKGSNQYRIEGRIQKFFLGANFNRQTMSMSAEWQHKYDDNVTLSASGYWANSTYTDQATRDARSLISSFGITRKFNASYKPVIFVNAIIGRDDALEDGQAAKSTASKGILGLRTGAQVQITPRFSLLASVLVQDNDYRAENVLHGKTREDTLYTASLAGTWLLADKWRLRGSVNYITNQSNISINSYDRIESGVSLRYDFD